MALKTGKITLTDIIDDIGEESWNANNTHWVLDALFLYGKDLIHLRHDPTAENSYGYIDKNIEAHIVLGKHYADAPAEVKIDVLKHECYHFLFNHQEMIHQYQDEIKVNPRAFNFFCDCQNHYKTDINPSRMTEYYKKAVASEGLPTDNVGVPTYEEADLRPLPPLVLFRLFKDKLKPPSGGCSLVEVQLGEEGKGFVSGYGMAISDDLKDKIKDYLKENGSKLSDAVKEQLDKLAKGMAAGTEQGTGRLEAPPLIANTPKWVKKLLKVVENSFLKETKRRYAKDSTKQEYANGAILFRGKVKRSKPGVLLFAIDTSGSMSSADLAIAMKGVYSLCVKHKVACDVICWDTRPSPRVQFTPNLSLSKLQQQMEFGGGGTDYNCVLPQLLPNDSVVIFTDTWLSAKVDVSKNKTVVVCSCSPSEAQLGHFQGLPSNKVIYVQEED